MVEDSDRAPGTTRRVPALPRVLADPRPVVAVGALGWLAGLVFFAIRTASGAGTDVWLWTCVAGLIIGVSGYGLFRWQRWASERQRRGSWRGSGLD